MSVEFRETSDGQFHNSDSLSVSSAFCANGTKCESPEQRPGNLRNEGQKPRRGEIIVHPHYALSGLPRSILSFPGAMPQAFTLCRVAARPFVHALRGLLSELTRRADAQPLAELRKQGLLKNQQPL